MDYRDAYNTLTSQLVKLIVGEHQDKWRLAGLYIYVTKAFRRWIEKEQARRDIAVVGHSVEDRPLHSRSPYMISFNVYRLRYIKNFTLCYGDEL